MQILVIVIVFSAVVPSYISLDIANNDVAITRKLVIKKKKTSGVDEFFSRALIIF